jgi:hypothetical protein
MWNHPKLQWPKERIARKRVGVNGATEVKDLSLPCEVMDGHQGKCGNEKCPDSC